MGTTEDTLSNGTGSMGQASNMDWTNLITTGLTSVALFNLIIATIAGNTLVLVAIWTQKNLKSDSNYLLFSLAMADLFVGLLVMPLGAVQIVTGQWLLGATWCEIWTFVDITCCSASILHLLSVAIDRYLSISLYRINWTAQKNRRSIFLMIAFAWLIAGSVAVSPLLGWKDSAGFLQRIEDKVCIVSQSLSFLFFGITVTFYMPLLLILLFYWRIWLTVRERYRNRMANVHLMGPTKETCPSAISNASIVTKQTAQTSSGSELSSHSDPEEPYSSTSSVQEQTPSTGVAALNREDQLRQKEAVESKRMKRAAKTLSIITGVFVVCWLPRFMMLPILVLCGDSCKGVSPKWADFTQWLGFSNSVLNPIIYTIYSKDFRKAFKKIICCKRRGSG